MGNTKWFKNSGGLENNNKEDFISFSRNRFDFGE